MGIPSNNKQLNYSLQLHKPKTLTGEALAELFDGRGHFLFADSLVLLSLRSRFQTLPGQRAAKEIHEHIAQRLHVVSPTLLCENEKEINEF